MPCMSKSCFLSLVWWGCALYLWVSEKSWAGPFGDCCWIAERGWDEMKRQKKRKGRMKDEVVSPGPQERGPAAGMKVNEKRSQSRPAEWAGLRNAEGPPRIGILGEVPSTYPPGPDPRHVWDSWWGGLAIGTGREIGPAYRRVSRNRSRGGGGGTSKKFLLGLQNCRFPYLQRTVMKRCIFACFLLIPYSYEHIGRQYTCPRLYSVHWFDDILKAISPILNERIKTAKTF